MAMDEDSYREAEPISGVSNGHCMDIVVAGLHIMREKEISKITVTEIAVEAGISRKTFYHYFHDVDELSHFIIDGVAEQYASNFTRSLIEDGNLDSFYVFKKNSIEYYYHFYRELAYTHYKNVVYENIFREWNNRALALMADAGANLSVKQCYALKAVTYNIMALFSDWEITDKKERGISIDELIEFFKWASEPLVECMVENRDEWEAVKRARGNQKPAP